MASLIRTKNQPSKWTALYNTTFLYKNNIVKYEDLTDKYDKIKYVKENEEIKKIIKHFLIKKYEFLNYSRDYITEKEQVKIAINIIIMLANIIKSFKLESDSMIKIAQKICYKVTGQNDNYKNDNFNLLIFNKLINDIDIKIYLPEAVFYDISNDYDFMKKVFYNRLGYFLYFNNNLFKIEIAIYGHLYSLDFNIKNIDKILNNVKKKLCCDNF